MEKGALLQKVYDMGEDRFLLPYKEINDTVYSILIDADGNSYGDFLFRKNGLGSKFKDGYAIVIMYCEVEEKEHTVIINNIGHVCLMQSGLNYMYLKGGHIAFVKDDGYYNLKSGAKLMGIGSGSSMETSEFIFVNNQFNFNNNDALGVHKINKLTLEVEIFPK